MEYRSKRQTLRLGPVQPRLVPTGTWAEFGAKRRGQLGGSSEQYKHPCLVADLDLVPKLTGAEQAVLSP